MWEFLKDVMKIGVKTLLQGLTIFAIGTGASAIACWYYGAPLVFSLLGGLFVLGVALALMSDSIFD